MLSATFLGLLLIPVFYVVVRRLLGDTLDRPPKPPGHEPTAARKRRTLAVSLSRGARSVSIARLIAQRPSPAHAHH